MKNTKGKQPKEFTLRDAFRQYQEKTPARVQVIDTFAVFELGLAVLVLVYGMLFSHERLNTFLSALFACVGTFVLTMHLRLAETEPMGKSPRRVLVEFVVCFLVLQFATASFIG